jgi:hypothetical protein
MWQGKSALSTITCVVFDGYSTNISESYATQQDAIHEIHIFLISALLGGDQLHAPAALSLGKSPQYPLERMLGGPQNRSGRHGEEKILDPTGTRTPTPRSSSP